MLTTIQVRSETKKRLVDIGKKGESYDAVISRILDERDNSGARSSYD